MKSSIKLYSLYIFCIVACIVLRLLTGSIMFTFVVNMLISSGITTAMLARMTE